MSCENANISAAPKQNEAEKEKKKDAYIEKLARGYAALSAQISETRQNETNALIPNPEKEHKVFVSVLEKLEPIYHLDAAQSFFLLLNDQTKRMSSEEKICVAKKFGVRPRLTYSTYCALNRLPVAQSVFLRNAQPELISDPERIENRDLLPIHSKLAVCFGTRNAVVFFNEMCSVVKGLTGDEKKKVIEVIGIDFRIVRQWFKMGGSGCSCRPRNSDLENN